MGGENELAGARKRRRWWASGFVWAVGLLWLPVPLYALLAWSESRREWDASCEVALLRGCRLGVGYFLLVFGAPLVLMSVAVGVVVALVCVLDVAFRRWQARRR